MSNTPVPLAIRMTSTTSTLTRMYHCHPHISTLVITGKHSRMIFFNQHQHCYRFVENLTSRTTQEHCVNRWCWDHDRNIHQTCHRHGHLARLSLDSLFILLSPTLHPHSLILSFLLILSIHVTLILSYPYIFTFILTHSLSFLQMRWIFL